MVKKRQAPQPRVRKKPAAKKKTQAKQRVSAAAPKRSKVDRRIALFVREYLIDMNGRQAAIRAGYEPDRARHTASELLAKPEVAKLVDDGIAAKAEAHGLDGALVVERIRAISTADPRELVEVHRGSCRFCWGTDHNYQRTPREMREARQSWERDCAAAIKEARAQNKPEPAFGPFDEEGGSGFNPYRDPHPQCPECFGEGEARTVLKDTRDLSPAARLLFAGAKQTQHGIEIRMHDQVAALRDLGKHFGVFRDRVELTGKNGGPVEHSLADVLDALEGADTGVGPAVSRAG